MDKKDFADANPIEKELLDRTRRMETKLHKLCDVHDIAPIDPTGGVIARLEDDGWVIIVTGMDTSLSAMKRALNQAVSGQPPKDVPIYLSSTSELLGYIDFT